MDVSVTQLPTLVVGGVIAIGGLYLYHQATRRKGMIIYKAKLMTAFLILYFGGAVVLSRSGYPQSTVILGAALLGLSAKLIVKRPSDTRYIPKSMKRAVIERDLPEGEEYDSKRHHFDHTVAFSKGGDTSVRNLRLLSKEKNLRKGAKRPRLRDFL
jgi:hypothetical protein